MKKYLITSAIAVLLILVLITCKKAPEIENNSNKKTLAVVVTLDVVNIATTAASCRGNVTNDGNSIVTEKGVCWSINNNPTIYDNKTTNGSGLGEFESFISELDYGITYFVRAYATNERGTSYGGQKSLQTLAIVAPTITTNAVTNISTNSAKSGGNVTDDGNSVVTEKGVCWSKNNNPTIDDNHTLDGNGLGAFDSDLEDLEEGTTYYICAYAINEKGISYGDEKTFTTIVPYICGDVLAYENQQYITVVIGSQCWMAENLNIGNRINGSQDMTDNSVIEKYCYDNNEVNCDQYGGLYQWDEMMQYTTEEGAQGICPDSWHIPTDEEWKTLEMALGMSQSEADKTGWRGTNEGNEMKSTNGWDNDGNGSNSTGFTALPGGYRYSSGSFNYLGYYGYWWSSTEYSGTIAWHRRLRCDYDQVYRNYNIKTYGFSVRCIKD